ncbi:MAG: hypothetical protein H7249_12250 [Chitinophagaceae bacterium]|nr:hypothetical protein [Oligoflexus sp.]
MDWIKAIIIALASPVCTAAMGYFWLERAKTRIELENQKQLANHKQTMDTYTESMKHSLLREMVRVEHTICSKFQIYPKLFAKFVRVQGAMEGLMGFSITTSYENATRTDIENMLKANNILDGEQQKILAEFDYDQTRGIKSFERIMAHVKNRESRATLQKAKNYWLLNELFISEDINKIATDLFLHLANAYAAGSSWTTLSTASFEETSARHTAGIEGAKKCMSRLKSRMNHELEPTGFSVTS